MGRKKGKQSGNYASKSLRAAHQSALSLTAFEEVLPNRKPIKWNNVNKAKMISNASSSISMNTNDPNRRSRLTVNVTQLRGILAERTMEDRLLDRDLRRRRRNDRAVGIYGGNIQQQQIKVEVQLVGNVERHEPGWLLFYNHNENEEEIGSKEAKTSINNGCAMKENINIPSLQSLCVRSLGPYLSDYIDACGADAIRAAIGTLSPLLIAELSASVCAATLSYDGYGVTDEIVEVLGRHCHVERLALHAPIGTLDDDDECGNHSGIVRNLTDEGILSLVPRLISQKNVHNGTDQDDSGGDGYDYFNKSSRNFSSCTIDAEDHDASHAPESWEDIDVDLDIRLEGCNQLRRLELCNIQTSPSSFTITFNAVYELLKSCPCITHLSISNSFDDDIGSDLLLHPEFGLAGNQRLLSNLQVLDVSHCLWMTDILLTEFLRTFVVHSSNQRPTLQMVSVTGCTGVTRQRCDLLNQQLGGWPLISTKVQKRTEVK
uniref:Uncharacterized protein n=1 Tax=Ditylum brightwellii TaxID=49249 RepID=A0A6U3SSS6_9STRA|mmetsp:Transcript_27429/g.40771  ORF Transcript_27429/g.40771 Transcript_27429/m.40771 type:complete len:489 (+) Transcript_27429:178-1644(+)